MWKIKQTYVSYQNQWNRITACNFPNIRMIKGCLIYWAALEPQIRSDQNDNFGEYNPGIDNNKNNEIRKNRKTGNKMLTSGWEPHLGKLSRIVFRNAMPGHPKDRWLYDFLGTFGKTNTERSNFVKN